MSRGAEDEYMKKYYRGLEGCTIKGTGVNKEGFPFFTAVKGKETFHVEVSRDPEGNGPGFLFGLPDPR